MFQPQIVSRSGQTIFLRQPQPGDESLLYDYALKLQSEDTYVLLNPDSPVSLQEETNYLKDVLIKIAAGWQVHYLAFFQDQLIGSVQVTKQGRRKMHSGSFGISLLPDFRHDGIGYQLAQIAIQEAAARLHLKLITLEVFANNQVAQKLYQKLGFTPYGQLDQALYYRQSYIPAIYMFKTLTSNEA